MTEPAPAGALAAQIHELRQQRAEDHAAITAATATVAAWNTRLEQEDAGAALMLRRAFKKLSDRVDGLAATLADALDRGKLKNPPAPRWDNLDQAAEAAQLAALRDWVNGVLLVQYPEYTLPGCWEAHRAALWELGNLRAEWQHVYEDPHGADLENALWFHERWLPGTISRLNRSINSEGGAIGCRQHGYSAYYGQKRA